MKKIYIIILILSIYSCGSVKFKGDPLYGPLNFESKKAPLSSQEKKQWHLLDLSTDSIPGMSVERAYKELIKKKADLSIQYASKSAIENINKGKGTRVVMNEGGVEVIN